MTARRKVDLPLKHRIVTFSGLGELTQKEIACRVGLINTSNVALGLVSRSTVSRLCSPYRQKKMEKEELFTLKDLKMMTGLRGHRRIAEVARRQGIGTLFAKHRVYSKKDVDRLLELFSPPQGCLTGGEVMTLFKIGPKTLQRWRKYLRLEPEKRFGILFFSKAQVEQIKASLALSKLNLTVKRLALESGVSYACALKLCRAKGFGQRAVSRSASHSLFLAQGDYGEAISLLLKRRFES